MKTTIRMGLALLCASVPAAFGQPAATPTPAPAGAPAPRAAAPSPTPKEDPLARARREPAKEEVSRTGKGANAEKDRDKPPAKGGLQSSTFTGLELRSLGPALTSGRIIDIAVDP
ncbi:MAG TPA: hypothetical protein VIZ58_06625, partial [Thermoanaerobaculia bacterium]